METYIIDYSHSIKYLFCPVCNNNFSFEILQSPGWLSELHKGIHERENMDTPEFYAQSIADYQESHYPHSRLYTDYSKEYTGLEPSLTVFDELST